MDIPSPLTVGKVLLPPKPPAYRSSIDPELFTPLTPDIRKLMRDCMTCVVGLWSVFGCEPSELDALGRLPDEVKRIIGKAIDVVERGYYVEVYKARHPDWPDRTFLFVVASKDGESFIYEYPTGEQVPRTVLLQKLAEAIPSWSWRNSRGKMYLGFVVTFVVIGVLYAVIPAFGVWGKAAGISVCLLSALATAVLPKRWDDAWLRKVKAAAAALQT